MQPRLQIKGTFSVPDYISTVRYWSVIAVGNGLLHPLCPRRAPMSQHIRKAYKLFYSLMLWKGSGSENSRSIQYLAHDGSE